MVGKILARRDSSSLLIASLALTAFGLAAFDFVSGRYPVRPYARKSILSDYPPVYGRHAPEVDAWIWVAIGVAALGAAGAFFVARMGASKPRWLVPAIAGFTLAFAAACTAMGGDAGAFTDPIERTSPADYQVDVRLVHDLGVRGFAQQHPALLRSGDLTSVHTRTHPPGPVVLLAWLEALFGDAVVPRALVIAMLSSLVVAAAWMIASRTSEEPRAGPYAAMLLAVAAAPAVFVFLSLDALYASVLGFGGALAVWGLGRSGSDRVAAAAGVALGIGSFFTYAAGFVAVAAIIYAFLSAPARDAVRRLAVAAVAGALTLVFLRVVLGFDLFASFAASYERVPKVPRTYWYWLFGNVAVWLTFAGVPIAALSLKELVLERPRYLVALFVPLLAANFTKIFPGETERIGQFAYPFIAAAAGTALARWETRSGRRRPAVVAALVAFSAAQAIVLESLFNNFW